MADQIDVVIEVAYKVLADVLSSPSCVSDELSLRHLVFYVRAGQVDGEQDERVAQHVDCVCKTPTEKYSLFYI